jgi:hypothetical protein
VPFAWAAHRQRPVSGEVGRNHACHQLRATASADLMTAALALGMGRTKAYDLARRDEFPCRVIRIGRTYRVPTAGLLELLGVTAEEPRGPNACRVARLTPSTGRIPSPARNQVSTTMNASTQTDHSPLEGPAPDRVPAGWQRRELVIWGAHGGAGTTTLASWLQPAWDMGAMSPEPDPPCPATIARGRELVVVCRNTAWSACQATKAVAQRRRNNWCIEYVSAAPSRLSELLVVGEMKENAISFSKSLRWWPKSSRWPR